MYYLCSENKGTDQLRGYREADLRLCFCICKNPVFSQRGSIKLLAMSEEVCQSWKPLPSFVTADQIKSEFLFIFLKNNIYC